MKKHTREPWRLVKHHDGRHEVIGSGAFDPAVFRCMDTTQADFARIVACVNALVGIRNPAAVAELIEAAQMAKQAIESLMNLDCIEDINELSRDDYERTGFGEKSWKRITAALAALDREGE